MHNDVDGDPERLTVVYKGIGSYTFLLKKSKKLEELAQWQGTCRGK